MHFGFRAWIVALALILPLSAQAPNTYRKGEWRSQDIPEGYFSKAVGRYQLQSNCPPAVVEKVGKHMNAMFKLYSKHFPSTKTPRFNLVIKLFADRKLYLAYGAPPMSGGYYSPEDKEMVGYYTGKLDGEMKDAAVKSSGGAAADDDFRKKLRSRFTIDTMGVFSHEGWHQYFHWSCGSQVPFPAWADEGIGEYYYPSWMKDGTLVTGAPNDYRLATIQYAIKKNEFVPLKDLVRYEQSQYYQNPDVCYAEGWSWVHFMFEHPGYAPKSYVQKFVQVFKDQHSIGKTIDIVFKGVDWERMQKDWIQWTSAMTPLTNDDGFTDASAATIARAMKVQNEMPENVRKALLDCLNRRKNQEKPTSRPAGDKSGPASAPASAPAGDDDDGEAGEDGDAVHIVR